MNRPNNPQNGFAALIGILIVAVIGIMLFLIVTRGPAFTDNDSESRVQNPQKYQDDVDEAITKAAEKNKELENVYR